MSGQVTSDTYGWESVELQPATPPQAPENETEKLLQFLEGHGLRRAVAEKVVEVTDAQCVADLGLLDSGMVEQVVQSCSLQLVTAQKFRLAVDAVRPAVAASSPDAKAPPPVPLSCSRSCSAVSSLPVKAAAIEESIVVCIDRSGSMGAPFSEDRTRMEAVKQMFYAFRDRTDSVSGGSHEIGLLQFDDKIERLLEPTAQLDQFEAMVDCMKHRGSTAIYSSIVEGTRMLAARHGGAERPRLRVLTLTDGQNNAGVPPEEALLAALRLGAVVDAIIVGDRPDSHLRRIVQATGGECFQINDLAAGFELLEAERVVSLKVRHGDSPPPALALDGDCLPSDFKLSSVAEGALKSASMASGAPIPAALSGPMRVVTAADASSSTSSRASGQVLRRAMQELKSLETNPELQDGVHIFPSQDDILKWNVLLEGPANSIFAGGVFVVSVELPRDYPFKPPRVRFVTPVFHCNISDSGGICLDILKDSWSPALSVPKVLQSIRSLLTDPNPDDSLRQFIAELTIAHRQHGDKDTRYPDKVRESIQQHASKTVEEWKQLWGVN